MKSSHTYLVLMLAIALTACFRSECDEKIEKIFQHLDAEEYRATITLCNSSEETCSDRTGLFFARAESYFGLGLLDSAIIDYTSLIALDPNDKLAYISRSQVYFSKLQYDLAIQDLHTHINKVGFNGEVAHNLTVNFNNLNQFDSAMYWCDRAIKMDDTNASYYATRAITKSHLKDTAGVLLDVLESSSRDSEDEYANVSCAIALSRVINVEEAIKGLEEALVSSPNSTSLYTNLAFKHQENNDNTQAITCYKKVVAIDFNAYSHANVALAYANLNNFDSALVYYIKAIELDHTYLNAYLNRAMTCWIPMAEYQKAESDFNTAIDLDPSHPYNYNNLGYVHFKLGKFNQALESVNYSLSLYEQNSYAYKNSALILDAQGKLEEAKISAQRALELEYPEKDQEFDSLLVKLGFDLSLRKELNFIQIQNKVADF